MTRLLTACVCIIHIGSVRVALGDTCASFSNEWGTLGYGPGQFFGHYGVVADTHHVFISDYNHRIQVFTKTGSFLYQWGQEGSGQGELQYPNGLATWQDKIYVADTGNGRVEVFNKTGGFIQSLDVVSAIDVAVDLTGDLYVLGEYAVVKFDSAGEYILEWNLAGDPGQGIPPGIGGIAIGDQGTVYVSVWDPEGSVPPIQKFSTNGIYLGGWGEYGLAVEEFSTAGDLAFDANGDLYVTDGFNNRVKKYSGSGVFDCAWGSPADGFDHPGGITINENVIYINQAYKGAEQVWFLPSTTSIGESKREVVTLRALKNPFSHTASVVAEFGSMETNNPQVRATVCSIAGRIVGVLYPTWITPTSCEFMWDGKTIDGRACADGVYVVRIAVDGKRGGAVKLLKVAGIP